jgi:hypothetical protein
MMKYLDAMEPLRILFLHRQCFVSILRTCGGSMSQINYVLLILLKPGVTNGGTRFFGS